MISVFLFLFFFGSILFSFVVCRCLVFNNIWLCALINIEDEGYLNFKKKKVNILVVENKAMHMLGVYPPLKKYANSHLKFEVQILHL